MKQTKFTARKRIMASASMLVISAVMLSTSTYAWFTMNKEVTVEGMQVRATSDNGLVISGDNKSTWQTFWDVDMSSSIALAPTSADGAASPSWVSNKSSYFDDADSEQATSTYDDLDLTYTVPDPANGDFLEDNGDGIGADGGFNYVMRKTFFIKASGTEALAERLAIKEVTARITHEATDEDAGDDALNRSLRVMVVIGGNAYIYAPVTGYDETIYWKGDTTTALTLISASTQTQTTVTSVPNVDANAIPVVMYIYFEGEDAACKSSNIQGITLDNIEVAAAFTTVASNG
jgi:hypothetical protein